MTEDRHDNQKNFLEEAVEQFVDEQLQGREPAIDEFVKKYPEFEQQVRKRIRKVHRINNLFDSLVEADESDFKEASAEHDLVGRKVGSFEITEMIGCGGMGVVYLAHDTKLKRSVAIKSMPAALAGDSTAQGRFRREAELLALLNHPNIAVIYDIIEQDEGAGYLILEYVPGETLTERLARGPFTVEQALSISQQIAKAISAAHKKGIIHRDLKPGNIKITPDGHVKVLDFGLAKATISEGNLTETTVTQRGRVLGTPAYMSPEQARGKSIDHRTDIWSFGCILYQMLTAHLPFEGETATDTLAHIIEREPDWGLLPEETPSNIRVLLRRCLEKDPLKRLDNIAEATVQISDTLSQPVTVSERAALPRLKRAAMIFGAIAIVALLAVGVRLSFDKQAQPPLREIRPVVLPFDNLGPADEKWFADGMTDEITTRLAYIHGLAVISRQSAIEFKKMGMSKEIAQEFNLDYFLEGTVQCARPSDPNSQVRIRIQLINSADDTHVWQETYDNNMSNIFQLQTNIAEKVAQALDMTLIEPEREALRYGDIDNTEAYVCFLQGHQYRKLLTDEGRAQAIEMFEKAIELEPNYAEAYASLADTLIHIYWSYGKNRELLPRAKKAADKALELAPDLPSAHWVLGRYYYQGCLDYERALEQYTLARKSVPSHILTIVWTAYVQKRQGRFEEALANLLRAVELNPIDPSYPGTIATTLVVLQRYDEAERYFEQAIRLDPDKAWAYYQKALLYLLWQGDTGKARKVVDEALHNNKELANHRLLFFVLVTTYIHDREYEEALKKLNQHSKDFEGNAWFIPNSLWRAEVYGYIGEKEMAKQCYESAVAILEDKVAQNPSDDRYHSSLGKAYAGLGREQEAIREGLLGVECLPVSKDTVQGPLRLRDLAHIYVMVGKYRDAIDILEDLLSMRWSGTSISKLRLNPAWDPLRKEPRFQKLIKRGK